MLCAHHRAAGDDAVAQRSASVRTLVVGSQEPVAEIEDRDLAIAKPDRASFAERDVLARGDLHPLWSVHASTFCSVWIGTNCDGVRGCRPSSQGSTARAFDFAKRSRRPCLTGSGAYTVSFRTFSMPVRSTKS